MLFLPLAHAETADVIPCHSAVVYIGAGATTYGQLNSGDPGGTTAEKTVPAAVQARLDLYGSWSPVDRLQLAVYIPPVRSSAVGQGDPLWTIAQAGVQARYAILRGAVPLSVGLGVASQAWNWDVRGRYVMVGEATTDVLPAVYLGASGKVGAWSVGGTAFGTYAWRFPAGPQPDVEGKAPADDVRGGVEGRVGRGPLTLQLGAYTLQRLGGTTFYALGGSDDVWAAVDYDNISVGSKLSVSLPKNNGLHLSVNRTIWVHNGPVDAMDVSLGWHHYFAP